MPEEKVEEVVAERKEGVLASLASHEGWNILKEFIEAEIKRLDELNKIQIEAGATFDEIGRNAVLVQLCKAELQTVINKVEDARESEQPRTS